MFGIGGFELFIILLFGFLIFGPDKLPEMARLVGKGIARFRQAQEEVNGVIKTTDIYDPNDPEAPFKDPMEALDKLAQHQEDKKRAAKAAEAPGAQATAKAATTAAASAGAGAAAEKRQESFTERKARYERERAARKAAEEAAAAGKDAPAEADKAGQEAASTADAPAPAGASEQPAAEKPAAAQPAAGTPASTEEGDE